MTKLSQCGAEGMILGNRSFFGIATVGVAGLFTLGTLRPRFMAEDGLVETWSAVGFAIASIMAVAVAVMRRAVLSRAEQLALAGIGAFCLLLALSEVSFGARLFGLQMPQMRGGGEFDGGHDIVIVLVRLVGDFGLPGMLAAAIGAASLALLAGIVAWTFRRRVAAVLRHLLTDRFAFRAVLGLAMLATALVLDLVSSPEVAVLEEVLEFAASVAFIGAVLVLALKTDRLVVREVIPARRSTGAPQGGPNRSGAV